MGDIMKYKFIKDMLKREYVKRGVRVESIQDSLNDPIIIPENIKQAYMEEVDFLKVEMGSLVKVIASIEVHLEMV